MRKQKYDFWNWKVTFMMCLQYFFDLFSIPFGYMFEFGTNYLKKSVKSRCNK